MRISFLILKDYRHAHNQSSGPIGLAYLSSAAKARFPDTHVQIEVDVDQVIASKPDLIGISAYTETYSQSIDAARYLKRHLPDIPIWLGGPHINALPGTLGKDFQLGVVGEGEDTFVELLALIASKRRISRLLRRIERMKRHRQQKGVAAGEQFGMELVRRAAHPQQKEGHGERLQERQVSHGARLC
jgi:radical SAM superfamily enzyme YgiQ (UPF0313 family)